MAIVVIVIIAIFFKIKVGLPDDIVVKNPAANAEDEGDKDSIPGSGRFLGEGN